MHKTSRFGDVLLNTAKVIFEAHSRHRQAAGAQQKAVHAWAPKLDHEADDGNGDC